MPSNRKKKNSRRLKKLVKDPEKPFKGKDLAKAAPEIASRLQQGEWVIDDLDHLMLDSIDFSTGTYSDQLVTTTGQSVNMFEGLFGSLVRHTAPGNSPAQVALREDLLHRMRLINQWQKDAEEKKGNTDMPRPEEAMRTLQWIFEKVVGPQKSRIVTTCFGGEEELFKKSCPAYKADPEDFFRIAGGWFGESIDTTGGLTNQLRMLKFNGARAVREITFGMHRSHYICWNCGKEATGSCPKCGAARYCSSDCQTAHWTKVHKPICKHLKEPFGLFLEGEKLLDKAFADTDAHTAEFGLGPSVRDYEILSNGIESLLIMSFSPELVTRDSTLPGPSLTNLYNNLRNATTEGFWAFKEPNSRPPPRRKARIPQPGSEAEPSPAFYAIGEAMLFDYSRLGNKTTQLDRFREIANNLYINKMKGAMLASGNFTEGKDSTCSLQGITEVTLNDWLLMYDDGIRCETQIDEDGYVRMVRKRAHTQIHDFMRKRMNSLAVANLLACKKEVDRKDKKGSESIDEAQQQWLESVAACMMDQIKDHIKAKNRF